MQNRNRFQTQAVRHVLDSPRGQRYCCSPLLPSQWPIRELLGGSPRRLNTSMSRTPSEVWEAQDPRLARLVAVKFLRPGLLDRAEFLSAVRRLQTLHHPNIVDVFELFEEDGRAYLVTDYVAGQSLEARLSQNDPLPLEAVLAIGRQVLCALDYAHTNGVLHLNVKPSNILIADDARVFLSDFSIGTTAPISSELAYFASPELVRNSAAADPRSDVYSFGCVMYAMLFGAAPRLMFLKDLLPRPDLSLDLRVVVAKCLMKDPGERYSSCKDVMSDLEAIGSGHSVSVRGISIISPSRPFPPPLKLPAPPNPIDDDVQFTVYRPQAVRPETWKMLLAFAHRSRRPEDAPPNEPDPLQEVQRQAEEILGQDIRDYRNLSQDSTLGIPREGVLTLIPEMEGVAFQPANQSLKWTGRVPPAVFLFCAHREFLGRTVRGHLCIYLGNIIVAQVPLSIRIENAPMLTEEPYVQKGARWYRRIFASYSHKDTAIVEEFERHAIAFGDDYLRDVTTLRTGNAWNEELRRMIRTADVFQLFWSHNSMNSDYVRDEYSYALGLKREAFVRPVYWQEPMPESKQLGLPPPELQQLHSYSARPRGRSGSPTVERPVPPVPLPVAVPRSEGGGSPSPSRLPAESSPRPAAQSSPRGLRSVVASILVFGP